MSKINKLVVALFLLVGSFSTSQVGAAEPKKADSVGVVDVKYVLSKYPKARQALTDLAKREQQLKQKLAKKQQELMEAQKAKKSKAELQIMADKIRNELEPEAKKFEEESKQMSKNIEKTVQAVIDKISADKGFELVLMRDAVVFGGQDISEEVIKALNSSK